MVAQSDDIQLASGISRRRRVPSWYPGAESNFMTNDPKPPKKTKDAKVNKNPAIDALFRSAKKRAMNEVGFQKTNDILRAKVGDLLEGQGEKLIAFAFTCECSDLRCLEDVHVTVRDFQRISKHKAWFCVIPEHQQLDIEKVIERHHAHFIVEKLPGLLTE